MKLLMVSLEPIKWWYILDGAFDLLFSAIRWVFSPIRWVIETGISNFGVGGFWLIVGGFWLTVAIKCWIRWAPVKPIKWWWTNLIKPAIAVTGLIVGLELFVEAIQWGTGYFGAGVFGLILASFIWINRKALW